MSEGTAGRGEEASLRSVHEWGQAAWLGLGCFLSFPIHFAQVPPSCSQKNLVSWQHDKYLFDVSTLFFAEKHPFFRPLNWK